MIDVAKTLTYRQKFVSKNQTQNCLLGISADTVLVIDAVTRETIDRHPFTQIRKWQVLHSFFSLYLQDHKEEYLTIEAETVSQVLFTHIHHALREVPVLQKRFGTNYDSVSRSYSRRRVSTDVEILSLEGDLANDHDPNVDIRRYAELILILICLPVIQMPLIRGAQENLCQFVVRRYSQ